MGKKKESFFEKLLKKNAEQEGQNNTKPKKRRSWKIIVASFVLAGVVAAGITIPLVINSTKVNYIDPLKNNATIYSYNDPNNKNKTISFTIQNLYDDSLKAKAQDPEKQIEQLNKLAIYYLYDQEAKASEEFQRLWNASLKSDEKENNNLRLKSLEELADKFKKEIEDLRENIKKSFGATNWENQFNQALVKNYGNAKNIDEAVQFKVFDSIKNDALRRFRLVTSDTNNLINRTANSDIYALNADGSINKSKILFKKGDLVFPWFKKNVNYYELNGKIMTLMTDSFVFNDEYKSADRFLDEYIKNNNPYVVSKFTLPGKVPTKADDKWSVDKEMFKRLMFYWPEQKDENGNVDDSLTSFNMVKKYFKSFDEYVKLAVDPNTQTLSNQSVQYSTVLTEISNDSDDTKKNWGSTGLTSLLDTLKSKDNVLSGLPLIKDIFNKPSFDQVDIYDALQKIQDSFGIAKPNFASVTSGDILKQKQVLVSKFNQAIKDLFDKADDVKQTGLYKQKYDSDVVEPIKNLFVNSTTQKTTSIYQLKGDPDTTVILSNKGITLLKYRTLDQFKTLGYGATDKDVLISMIKNDFIIKNKFSTQGGTVFNALTKINNNLTSQDYVNYVMLADKGFQDELKNNQVNIYALDKNGNIIANKKYTDEDIKNLRIINISKRISDVQKVIIDANKNIIDWMRNQANTKINGDFEVDGNGVKIVSNNTKSADLIIYEELNKKLVVLKELKALKASL